MLYYHASVTAVITVTIQMVSNSASHDDQGRSSRGKPNGYHHPFPVQEATEHVAYPFHPAIFLAQ
jgi:hypothetical protein